MLIRPASSRQKMHYVVAKRNGVELARFEPMKNALFRQLLDQLLQAIISCAWKNQDTRCGYSMV
jgi:hypothetical protein